MPGYKAQPLAQLDDMIKGPHALPEAGVTGSPDRSEIISSDNQKHQHTKTSSPAAVQGDKTGTGLSSSKWIQKGLKTAFAFFRPLVSNIHPKNGTARLSEEVLPQIPTNPAKAGKSQTDHIPATFLRTSMRAGTEVPWVQSHRNHQTCGNRSQYP